MIRNGEALYLSPLLPLALLYLFVLPYATRWRDKELFYISSDGTLMAVQHTADPVFPFSEPQPLFRESFANTTWDITRDGQRILVALPVSQGTATPFTVLLNWQETLKEP